MRFIPLCHWPPLFSDCEKHITDWFSGCNPSMKSSGSHHSVPEEQLQPWKCCRGHGHWGLTFMCMFLIERGNQSEHEENMQTLQSTEKDHPLTETTTCFVITMNMDSESIPHIHTSTSCGCEYSALHMCISLQVREDPNHVLFMFLTM